MVTLLSRYANNLRKDRRAERSPARQTLRPAQRTLAAIPKRYLVICTPPEARGSILRDCNHLWRVGHATEIQGRIKAPFAGTICSTPFLKSLLFEHGREALQPSAWKGYSANFALTEFSEVWPSGAQRSSRSTCRTDAQNCPHDLPFGGCPSTRPAIPSKAT